MSYNPYKEVDKNILSKLSFTHSACNYVYATGKSNRVAGKLYETDSTTYYKIKGILSGDPSVQVNKEDKVYVLPGHPLAQTRIKEYLKSVGANVTKSLNAATVVAGCIDFCETTGNYDSQAKQASLMFESEEIYKVNEHDKSRLDATFSNMGKIGDDLKAEYKQSVACYISNRAALSLRFDSNIDLVKTKYFLTPSCMEVIYAVLSKGLKVITEDTIAEKAHSGLKLEDESTYESIRQMLNSGDYKNQQLGVDIMSHCDLTGEILYNVWRLATNFYNVVNAADHNKGLNYFKSRVDWNELRYMRPKEFIEYADKKGKLTKRMLVDLLPDIYSDVLGDSPVSSEPEYSYEEDYFFECKDNGDFSYTVQLKDKWKKQLKEEVKDELHAEL